MFGRLDASERRRAVLASLTGYFGKRAGKPVDFVEQDWSAEEWTRGCYGAHMAPGVMTQFGPVLREPVGRIHWAGTETATVGTGYMDGAIRAGLRAAEEVLASRQEGRAQEAPGEGGAGARRPVVAPAAEPLLAV